MQANAQAPAFALLLNKHRANKDASRVTTMNLPARVALEEFLFHSFLLPFSSGLLGRSRFAHYKDLRRNESLSMDEIRHRQQLELKKLLEHCFEHVTFYRESFKQLGITPQDISSIEDYAQLPVLERKHVKRNLHAMVADNFSKDQLVLNATGGSTGTPLKFYEDRQYKEIMRACWMRGHSWVGWKPGMRNVWLWGATKEFTRAGAAEEKLKNWFNRRIMLSANVISESILHNWVQTINRFRPRFLYAYSSALRILADYVSSHRLQLPSIEAAIATADTLWNRERIEQVLGCAVYSQYGCREILHIASECKYRRMHISSDTVLVEFVPLDSSSQLHKVIATPLHGYGMPLLRYDFGDFAVPEPGNCTCGLPFPSMSLQVGRISDCLSTTSGALVPPGVPTTRIGGIFGSIEQFQVVQRVVGRLDVYIVKTESSTDVDAERLVSELRGLFGQDMQIAISYVNSFPKSPSGKHRAFVSELSKG
jgi:phenylacetate-CoA ligase